jgi:hypothetical protein
MFEVNFDIFIHVEIAIMLWIILANLDVL